MGIGLLNSAVSGMSAAQIGLQTAEHNIANQSTAGFSRQRIIQTSNTAMLTGSGFVGQGTNVSTVERMYSRFLSNQVNSAQTTSSELETYYAQIAQIDNMLADVNSGLSPALQSFFTGLQQVAANPLQLPARQAMLSSAQSLVARFQGLEERLSEIYAGVNSQVSTQVATINSYANQIGALNQTIIIAQSSNNQPANDLLDQRDQLVSDLNKLIKVSTTTETNGSFNVYIGTGQQLVVGAQVMTMTAAPSSADPSKFVLGLKSGATTQEMPESLITGGSLGGLLKFRSETLDKTANDLGRNAASLALTFNAQYALGQDLLGQASGDPNFVSNFFTVPTPKVVASSLNPLTSPEVRVSYSPPPYDGNFYTDLTNSDYRLDSNGTSLTLTRLTDNVSWTGVDVTALNAAVASSPQGSQGFTIDVPSSALVTGSSYVIQPTREAARNISVNATIAADARQIAAAAPIRTQLGATNTGSATITAGKVATGYTAPAAGSPVTVTYNGGDLTFPASAYPVTVTVNGVASPGSPYAAGPVTYVNGATVSFSGISFEISGAPKNGDTFQIARNSSGVSDSRNALLLGQLQTQNTMSGKTASYQTAYAQLVSDVGNKTRQISVTGDAQQALLKQTQTAREALSGVNLDEEAANLIKYQQAYQASAKAFQIGTGLFDTLLGIMR